MANILGLDLSTSTCGFAIVDDKKIVTMGFIDISKQVSYKEKAMIIIQKLETLPTFHRIQVEDSLSGFSGGGTSQQIILMLAKTNAVVSYIIEEHFGIELIHGNPSTVRKNVFGRSKISGMKSKVFVKQEVEKLYNISNWNIINKRKNIDKRMDDARDALVMALWNPTL